MSQQQFQIDLLGSKFDVRVAYLNSESGFTVTEKPAQNSEKDIPKKTFRVPRLLPVTACEVEFMELEVEHNEAARVTARDWLIVEDLRVGTAETIAQVHESAKKRFSGDEFAHLGLNQKRTRYTHERYGQPYTDLVKTLRDEVVTRYLAAFERVYLVEPMRSWRNPGVARDIVQGLEIIAPPHVIQTMIDLARRGHVHSQYLAALLLCFDEQGLTKRSVELLIKAHHNCHPQALDSLARFLLSQREYLGAVQCGLIAMESKYGGARHTIERALQAIAPLVDTSRGGLMFGIDILLHDLDVTGYTNLAREHFREWFPHPEAAARAFFERHMGGARHV